MAAFVDVIPLVATWTSQIGILQDLLSTQHEWWVTAIPLILCIVGVNLFFRHALAIMWFSVKIVLSVVVYFQIREVVYGYVGTDPLGIDATLFGVNGPTLQLTMSIGKELVKSQALAFVGALCPTCFPTPPPIPPVVEIETSPWVHWMGSTLFI
jgi:hypothetical protein